MTTNALARQVIGGIDTHKSTHHVAALDAATGQLLGDQEFPANRAGYHALQTWLGSFGEPVRVGIEGTGSFGAGVFRHLNAAGVEVIEVARQNRQTLNRPGSGGGSHSRKDESRGST
ncbi:IS110 family transposase, partial [Sporichthya brevicatena]|uniref:IS110 family transposase n=1 Tax=Sporichthya brevicatena TaxID=171442 RepID=UPI0031DC337A